MNKERLRKNWLRMALVGSTLVMACILSVSLRPAPTAAQSDTTTSATAGPIQLRRGQKVRLSAFVPAALRGRPKTLDLKFVIKTLMQWTVVEKSFEVDRNLPFASVELQITASGDVIFEQQTIATLPAGLTSLDICGHEITHGVTGNSPATAATLEVGNSETGVTRYVLTVSEGGGMY